MRKISLVLIALFMLPVLAPSLSAQGSGSAELEEVSSLGDLPDILHDHDEEHEKGHDAVSPIPPPLEKYQEAEKAQGITGLAAILAHRVKEDPFNLVATIIFGLAILHTFLAGPIRKYAHKVEHDHEERIKREGRTGKAKPYENAKDDVSIWGGLLHFLGEIEAIFGLWLIPLGIAIVCFYGFHAFEAFIGYEVNYTEPMFVVVIMALASTRPVIKFAEAALRVVAKAGGNTPASWWLSILIIAPLLGSFITEPAAMTIAAILLGRLFYRFEPSNTLKYATLGLLFVNVSVGGTLTHFAAPPVLMVAGTWGWDLVYMFDHFGYKAATGIIISTALYYLVFRGQFKALKEKAQTIDGYGTAGNEEPVPFWVTGIILLFMVWTVLTLHYPALFIGGFLFFLGFFLMTQTWQEPLSIRGPLLVGFFLAALVTHGKLQQWWIAPVLGSLGEVTLFIGSTVLTAFNDNAAITFLASQVPEFATNETLQNAVVYGAVTGGGLTVIANAPNPAGQSILQRYFGNAGISPAGLALGALIPTIIVGLCFWFLPHV